MTDAGGAASPTLLGPRHRDEELLDRDEVDPAELARSLELVDRVNRWLGGWRALRRHLDGLHEGTEGLRVLDVGCGAGHGLLRLRERWVPAGVLVGVDRHPGIVPLAAAAVETAPRTSVVRADALRLPFPSGAFDLAISTLTLHHFFGDDAVHVLREMARVARLRVLVNDLERHALNYLAARLLAVTLWRKSPVTRHDGPLSVRRSYTPGELRRLGEAAGLGGVRVRRHFPFRLVLEGRP